MTSSALPLAPLSIGEVMDRAVTLVVRNALPLTLLGLTFEVPLQLVIQSPSAIARAYVVPFILVFWAASVLWSAVLAAFLSAAYRGEPVSLRRCYGIVLHEAGLIVAVSFRVLGFGVLAVIALAIGLGIVGVVLWAIGLRNQLYMGIVGVAAVVLFELSSVLGTYALFEVVVRSVDSGVAVRRAFANMFPDGDRRRAAAVLAAWFALSIPTYAISWAGGLFTGLPPVASGCIQALMAIVSATIGTSFLLVVWYDWRVRREGLDLALDLGAA